MEKDNEYNLLLCFAFIYYKKAFDSVNTSVVIKSSEDMGTRKHYIKFIRKQQQSGKGKAKIKFRRGVGQGNTISLEFFTTTLKNIFKK